ncbi:uncharacterized protein LOC107365689 [Tetranychus urticae]|uniref:Uncharacterized protein n=1 Tax=Tetranychus urticae TaxID=32264 RepID=T1KMF4_TETUR|nr:uncharacterized protein LOC107365689 [Tetranychus urticae]
MIADNIDSEQTVIKVKLSGEDYRDIVIDWTDTSQAYEQQVFSRLAEISEIPVERNAEFTFMVGNDRYERFINKRTEPKLDFTRYVRMWLEFNRENLSNLINGNEHFGLALRPFCDDNKHFYIGYIFVPERLMDPTECTLDFCHYSDNRARLKKLKAIVNNSALQSQMAHLLVQPRWPLGDGPDFHDRWRNAYRRFNVMQYLYRTCYPFYQNLTFVCQYVNFVPAQLYLRTRG